MRGKKAKKAMAKLNKLKQKAIHDTIIKMITADEGEEVVVVGEWLSESFDVAYYSLGLRYSKKLYFGEVSYKKYIEFNKTQNIPWLIERSTRLLKGPDALD